jgi:uncharacterized protein
MPSAEIDTPPVPVTLRDVPWLWRDLAIGVAPIVLLFVAVSLVGPVTARLIPRWLWIPITFVELTWMFVFPLWIARRRIGLPALPNLRRILIEALIVLGAVPAVMVIVSGVEILLSRFMGPSTPSSPFEAIASQPEPYHAIALLILGIVGAPLAEEVFYRGMLYNALRKRMHFLIAALIQAALFALSHPFGFAERLAIGIIGFCLALLYHWRKTLVSPILFHALNNAIMLGALLTMLAIAANAPVLGVRGETHEQGCRITELVKGGAAEEAGLRVGDVITGAGENSVGNIKDVVLIMRMKKVGDRIPVWFIRDGETLQVEAVLKPRPK